MKLLYEMWDHLRKIIFVMNGKSDSATFSDSDYYTGLQGIRFQLRNNYVGRKEQLNRQMKT